ncbi:zinc ribbon domain-containing protein [Piscinibacter sp. Jin2]|uniref:Zinc ribbon domain-containing protein n=1 Tax=Aquariibacter lacus TaxID=2801332 RepID=A0A9X0XFJ5_9BURK|nr:FmdB family zinc ribbon protein [Piscinibacter lacus]MBL0719053.1 zinc ribbon domain-containing protein [Piscinibacter lacus]
MPIYAYRCEACGHAQDVLQKISDPLLSTCPACGAEAYRKQVTAAGFQLKGSGWYVTDFRNGSSAAAPAAAPAAGGAAATATASASPAAAAPAAAPASDSAAASGPSTACGGPCACH